MILLITFLTIVPFLLGQPVRKILDRDGRGVVDTYICGVMTMFAISGVLHFFVMFTNRPFSDYFKFYPIIVIIPAIIGIVLTVMDIKRNNAEFSVKARIIAFFRSWFKSKELQIFGALTLIAVLLCVVRIISCVPDVKGDFTLETIRTTLQTNSIYQYNSLTGQILEEGMPIRQQILTLPFFQAFLSEFFNVEVTLLLYKIFPCYALFLTILAYSRFAGTLFVKQKEHQMFFLFIISFMLLVGDYAHAAPAALMLHQGFTGKAMCVGVIIPFAVYACMNRKWLLACMCVVAELFLIWTTYGLGFCVLVLFLFTMIEIVGKVIKK